MLKEEHEITIKQLCRLIGYQGHNHSAIREALKGLISTVIEWNLIDDVTGVENWTASSMIASVSLEGPLCYYAYSPRMKQLLHTPSMFGKIDLVIQSRFRSSYGLALYENCIRYRGLPHTKWFEMDLFKKLMGIPAGMYDVFRDFKRRVLDKAVDEVNTYSDMVIAAECVREGRKVVRVRFGLKERAKKTRLGTPETASGQLTALPHAMDTKDKLTHVFGLSAKQVKQVLADYETAFIEEKMAVIEAGKSFQEGRVQNLAGYLISALKHDYQMPAPKQREVVSLDEAKRKLELAELRRIAGDIKKRYADYRDEGVKRAVAALSLSAYHEFMAQFTAFAETTVQSILRLQKSRYTRETVMDSPHVQALFRQFAARELDLTSIVSLEEFVAGLDEPLRESWHQLNSYDPDHATGAR